MEREPSMGGLSIDFEKLAIEKGRPLDVEDLDDEGWGAASEQKKILELGSLGEGAGGAVTRCMLDGGKTVFALKVTTTSQVLRIHTDRFRSLRPVQTRT
jgi:mitogen-activated protein kinase kinase